MAKISKDWVEAYFDYGVDNANRCIFLSDDVDQESIGHVIKGLYLMENENDTSPIELRICSYGGHVYDMFALHDVTRTLKSPVHTMGMGKVMSAAVLLVACGEENKRWAGANTSFMIHVPSADAQDDMNLHEFKIEVKEMERLWDRWYALMAKYTKKDAKFWKSLCNKKTDVYFDADQAQEWGVIDHIWDEKEGEESDS
jgi:ATP-dependent Clp protease protease subunit